MRAEPGFIRNAVVVTLALALAVISAAYMVSSASFTLPFGRQTIYAEFAQAPGTNPATTHKVTIAGVNVGEIVGSQVTDHGTAKIEMNIDKKYAIYSNAHAVLTSINPLNEMFIEISPGGPPAPELRSGGVIPVGQTSRPIQVDEILHHLDTRSQHALQALLSESTAALARAPQTLPGAFRATDATVVTLKPVMEKLQVRRDKIAQLVTALTQISDAVGGNQQRIAHLSNAAEQAFGTLSANDRDITATLRQLPGFSDQLRNALGATQDFTKELNPTLKDLDRASEKLPDALDRTTDTAQQLRRTMDDAGPFVDRARDVVHDLKPFAHDLDNAMDDFRPLADKVDADTAKIIDYLPDLRTFVFNTSSVFGVHDARGAYIRAELVAPLPDLGQLPGQHIQGAPYAVDTPSPAKTKHPSGTAPHLAPSGPLPNLGANSLLGGHR
jgi:phospholipid/cholesterol/gamma-HCH transport system substrate-binding protein